MAISLTGLITETRARLNEATAKQWSDVQLTVWINEGLRDIARRTEVLQARTNITAVVGTQEYLMPTDVVRAHRVEYIPSGSNQPNYPLEYRDWQNMDSVWWTSQGITRSTPSLWTMWGYPPVLKLIVYPTPAVAGTLRLFYYRLPALLVSGGDVAEVPEGWHDAVTDYCEYSALRRDADGRWTEAKGLYEQKLDELYTNTRRWADQAGSVEVNTNFVPAWLWNGGY